MINLEQLKADRKAGSDGPWLKRDTRDGSVFFSAPESQLEWIDFASVVVEVDGEVDLEGVANADRIARLPELEAAYIEAVELLELCAAGCVLYQEIEDLIDGKEK